MTKKPVTASRMTTEQITTLNHAVGQWADRRWPKVLRHKTELLTVNRKSVHDANKVLA